MYISTLGSHSSLQILHGAKKEGFNNIVLSDERREKFYKRFQFIDKVKKYSDLDQAVLLINEERDSVFVPHGSLIEYLKMERVKRIEIPIFGNRNLFEWESNQKKKMSLLKDSNIHIPTSFESPEDVDRLVIVKLPGAKGGKGYFLAKDKSEVKEGLKKLLDSKQISSIDDVIIQEYVIGIPMYFHFFYSPILNRLEITGMDIRYETNVDGLRRLPSSFTNNIEPSFVVAGNIPVIARESLLPQAFEYAENFVNTVKNKVPPGMIGPFCLESSVTEDLDIIVFEFSGRIVAGTNLYVNGSPYSWLYWDEPMSVGRRIAREIKLALEQNRMGEITT
ncbi:formate--phosphoribosylaminoimidazolecarboxamide ligase [Acidianus sulfidivorans JP7]|uniref:5-formaminoimidazole-4-carboxamide-1-(beta)-D-ribofuranosyl 5'-monophosphate synthetase n=1 Tax=Acidianus sulfidivorans JP7 TaxID=619593 RepID=A0A2U9IMQ0_9CREN|nr:formate--phosphoribosylaminoimidazolecarboxamide ligase [Acidianus sulfidivorans]AWR97214.1 formate--phosphoribosylaminoimidazolecarboxamide ligase [Acidianus sulfidivorans JP7]